MQQACYLLEIYRITCINHISENFSAPPLPPSKCTTVLVHISVTEIQKYIQLKMWTMKWTRNTLVQHRHIDRPYIHVGNWPYFCILRIVFILSIRKCFTPRIWLALGVQREQVRAQSENNYKYEQTCYSLIMSAIVKPVGFLIAGSGSSGRSGTGGDVLTDRSSSAASQCVISWRRRSQFRRKSLVQPEHS